MSKNVEATAEKSTADRLALAVEAARSAGEVTLKYFGERTLAVERKSDASPVTVADREAEEHLRRLIGDAFPDDAILGEELPERQGKSGYRWILDPIDGTKTFISGVPLYGTLIGLEKDGEDVAGVIHMPALAETVYAARGQGAWHVQAGKPAAPARVSEKKRLGDGLFCLCEQVTFLKHGRGAAYDELQQAAWLTRTWGDCYGYLLVATGRAEAMVDAAMSVWDAAALKPILEEAGGSFTDWRGRPTIHGGEGVGANRQVRDEVLAITRRFAKA